MPKIITIRVVYGRRINLGDYNNAHLECELTADLDEADDPEVVSRTLWETARDQVRAQAVPLVQKSRGELTPHGGQ